MLAMHIARFVTGQTFNYHTQTHISIASGYYRYHEWNCGIEFGKTNIHTHRSSDCVFANVERRVMLWCTSNTGPKIIACLPEQRRRKCEITLIWANAVDASQKLRYVAECYRKRCRDYVQTGRKHIRHDVWRNVGSIVRERVWTIFFFTRSW